MENNLDSKIKDVINNILSERKTADKLSGKHLEALIAKAYEENNETIKENNLRKIDAGVKND